METITQKRILSLFLCFLLASPAFAAVGLIAGSRGAGSQAASTTQYAGYNTGFLMTATGPTGESSAQTLFRTDGTLSNLFVFLATYDRGTGTIQSRKSAGGVGSPANGNMSMSITGTGDFTDASNSDSVASGDYMDWSFTTGSGGTTSALTHAGAIFTPTSGSITLSKWGGYAAATTQGFQVNAFNPINGTFQGSSGPTEGQYQWQSDSAGTWRNLWIYLTANTYSGGLTGTFRSRVNTANGNQAVSITNGATGVYEDNTHTDTVALNDKLSTEFLAGGTSGSGTIDNFGSEFGSANGTQQVLVSTATNNGLAINPNSTVYTAFGGTSSYTTDALGHVIMHAATTTSLFQVQVVANSLNSGQVTTFKVFKNGSAGNEAVSNTATATGYLQDATHTDSFTATDTFSVQMVTGAGTAIGYNGMGVLSQTGTGASQRNMPPVIF